MKIAFLAASDSGNYPFLNLIKIFKARGHEVHVFCLFENYNHIKIFVDNYIEVTSVGKMTSTFLDTFDLLFVSENFPTEHKINCLILEKDIFVVSLAMLFENDYIYPYSDLIFTLGENKIKTLEDLGYKIPFMATGNPQYDNFKDDYRNSSKFQKIILYIDQGLYPVGSYGKSELAKMLIAIAINNPEYKVIVKPRYLPYEKDNQVHICYEHIYDYIIKNCTALPENLVLLRKNVILRDLIRESSCIITPRSTAYLEAILMNKRIVLIEGLPSVECPDIRESRIERSYLKLRETGCVVNYKEILKYLPSGLEINQSFLTKEVYDFNTNATKKIIEVCEYIYTNLICKNKILQPRQFDYINYQESIKKYATEDSKDRKLNKLTNRYIQKAISIKYQLNIMNYNSDIIEIWEARKSCYDLETLNKVLNKIINKHLASFISNNDEIYTNKISQANGFYFLFYLGEYNEIINFPTEKILCEKEYHYFTGKAYFQTNDYQNSITFLKKYLELVECNINLHYKSKVDHPNFILSAFYYIGLAYFNIGEYDKAMMYFKNCLKMTEGKHAKALEYINLCKKG